MAEVSVKDTPEPSDILARCKLFSSLTRSECELIAGRSEVRTINAGALLLAEGDIGDEMYVLIDGVLEAFKRAKGEEVILQRNSEAGAHMGEMSLIKSDDDSRRRASVRSLCESHVLVVPKSMFLLAMQLSPAIKQHMNSVHHRQIEQLSLVERSVMYRALALFDQESGWSREEYFEPGQVIVAEGDPPSAVYVVRSGSVKRCRMEDGEEVVVSVLQDGQTFGGLAVLKNRPHTAAAIAMTAVDLVTFDREQFLEATAAAPELHEYLGAINRIYAMNGGLATVFDGEFRGHPAVVTVVRLDDGRELIVNHVIDKEIYSASLEIPESQECEEFIYRDDNREILRILTILNGTLMQVHVEGPWPELDRVHTLLLERGAVTPEALQQFSDSGFLLEPSPEQLASAPDAIFCQCLGLTRMVLETAIAHGADTLETLSRETGATTVCGSCTATVASLLSSTGQDVELSEIIEVTADVRSFRFTPSKIAQSNGEHSAEPLRPSLAGQHVVISAEIDGAWVQRPYTVTSPAGSTRWREITVKREDHGLLSNWLFKKPQQPRLKLSHPKGDFWVDPKHGETVVCLVAGIGMTPALAIARSIAEDDSDQILHIDYSARTQVDFAYRNELDKLAAKHSNITVNYRATGGRQRLDAIAVQSIHSRLPKARYLICGPQAYMKSAVAMLVVAGVKPERMQLETFTQVGHAPLETASEQNRVDYLQLILTLGLCLFYLIQSSLDWQLPVLAALQQLDAYRNATGSLLLLLIGYQWYLPYLRLTGQLAQTEMRWHSSSGVIAPVLLYLHSVSLGFAYTTVLALLFVVNTMIGALDKSFISNLGLRQRYRRLWLLVHVPASCAITVMVLIHMVYALAYS